MRIREILDPHRIILDLHGKTKREILTELSRTVVETRPAIDHERLIEALLRREETSTTAIADGIAIPHGKLDFGEEVLCAFGRARAGVDFDSIDGNPTRLFFLLISPEVHPSLHLRWLAHLAVTLKSPVLRSALLTAETPEEVLKIFEREEETQATTARQS